MPKKIDTTHQVNTNHAMTVLTLIYQDKFGREKSFVTCAAHQPYNQGQGHDEEVRRHMKRLGITRCKVRYDDFNLHSSYTRGGHVNTNSKQVTRLHPRRRQRTVKL